MTYELAFDRRALKEWQKLGHTIREQFKKKLAERLENPRVPAARLHGHADRYKIKLRASGYRLVYQVIDEKVVLLVIAVGRREGTVAKLAMRQPFVLFKGLTFQKLCLPGAFRPGDHHNKMLRPGLCVVHASPQYL